MGNKNINFTKESLIKLPSPTLGKRSVVYDTKQRNLCLIVTDSGSKSFYFRKTINGKPVRFSIGRFPDVSIEKAREKIIELLADLNDGINPDEARIAKREELTFDEFFKIYIEKHAKPHKKSYWFDEEQYTRHIKAAIGNYKLSEITRHKMQEFHSFWGVDSGKTSANRILDIVSSAFNIAIQLGYYKGDNPARGIKKFKMVSRDRFIKAEELPKFFTALNDYTDNEGNIIKQRKNTRDYVLLSLYTGARKGNVISIKWTDLNLEAKEWYIKETKNGTPQTIPLVNEVVKILKERKREFKNSEFVFPSNSASGHMKDPKKGWKDLLKRAKIENLRIHDLRRTLGSWQAITGSSLPIIGKSLNHKSHTSTSIYARLDLDPVRNSMENAVKKMIKVSQKQRG